MAICKHCGKDLGDIKPLEVARHTKHCVMRPKKTSIKFPDVTVFSYAQKHPNSHLKAIRYKCLDCCAGQVIEVELCPVDDCPLWTRRFGRQPEYSLKANHKIDASKK